MRLLISCEHASNAVPEEARQWISPDDPVLLTHRGYDIGAAPLAEAFADGLDAPLLAGMQTRLLIDLNRSPGNPSMFSEYTAGLSEDIRARLLHRYHRPYWNQVETLLAEERSPLFQLSVHSFTPVLGRDVRSTDIGLLFSTTRQAERPLIDDWARALRHHLPHLQIDLNRPYSGDEDGLVPNFSQRHPSSRYQGIELEVRQDMAEDGRLARIAPTLVETFAAVFSQHAARSRA